MIERGKNMPVVITNRYLQTKNKNCTLEIKYYIYQTKMTPIEGDSRLQIQVAVNFI
jgi:hypothetical protein